MAETEPRRVEIPPYHDEWMKGDRFGMLVSYQPRTKIARVRLDKSGRVIRVLEYDLRYLDNAE